MFWQKGRLSAVVMVKLAAQQEAILNSCVFRETSADPNNWSKDNPAHGNCAVIA